MTFMTHCSIVRDLLALLEVTWIQAEGASERNIETREEADTKQRTWRAASSSRLYAPLKELRS